MSGLAVEYAATYTLVGPDGTKVVFNDASDENFVGALSVESSGLDSAEVRESYQDAPEADGGVHGDFFYGRRPVTLQGTIIASSAEDRNTKVAKLKAATSALRDDAVLTWQPKGEPKVELRLRRQQPLRVTAGYVKEFFAAMVSALAPIQSVATNEKTISENNKTAEVVNDGDVPALPTITIHGPLSNPDLINTTTGEEIQISHVLVEGETLVVDFANHTLKVDGEEESYGSLDFPASAWWALAPGKNVIKLSASVFVGPAKAVIAWKDAYS
jgi:hypothetical protein